MAPALAQTPANTAPARPLRVLGRPVFEPEIGQWVVWQSAMICRAATHDEIDSVLLPATPGGRRIGRSTEKQGRQ